MHNKTIILFFLSFFLSFSQDKNKVRSYYFDTYQLVETKDFYHKIFVKSHRFTNSKDDSYSMELRYETNGNKTASIMVYKSRVEKIDFDTNFEYNQPSDLNKLINSKLYTVVIYNKPKTSKKIVQEINYENDSINNQIIVHIKRFKNKKKKKTINETYYFLSNNNSSIFDSKIKLSFTNSDLIFLNELNIDKIVSVNDKNEITNESTFLDYKKIDFTFTFKIDEIFPKTSN